MCFIKFTEYQVHYFKIPGTRQKGRPRNRVTEKVNDILNRNNVTIYQAATRSLNQTSIICNST